MRVGKVFPNVYPEMTRAQGINKQLYNNVYV